MADVTTYKRATMAYAALASGVVVRVGDVRAATDPIVTANPQWWVALADADFTTSDVKKQHNW
jgi:hypothetical protein